MKLEFGKYRDGLVPAIVQDPISGNVLMLGFMNEEAVERTIETRRVTFFSRSRNRLWTKGETSGNFLELESLHSDCDNDTLLIKARPLGPVCHTGQGTCFGETGDDRAGSLGFLKTLADVIANRRLSADPDSYVAALFGKGLNAVAQKVGEEAVELVIAAKDEDLEAFRSEAADLLFHYLLLLDEKGVTLDEVIGVLAARQQRSFNDAAL